MLCSVRVIYSNFKPLRSPKQRLYRTFYEWVDFAKENIKKLWTPSHSFGTRRLSWSSPFCPQGRELPSLHNYRPWGDKSPSIVYTVLHTYLCSLLCVMLSFFCLFVHSILTIKHFCLSASLPSTNTEWRHWSVWRLCWQQRLLGWNTGKLDRSIVS